MSLVLGNIVLVLRIKRELRVQAAKLVPCGIGSPQRGAPRAPTTPG
ncbi:MAG: hypothetical protein ABSE84_00740 [Isosphaeraceae bacterium]